MDSGAICTDAAKVAVNANKPELIQKVGVRNPTIGRDTTWQ